MTWIKICGTTNVDDALAAVQAGADAVGFVFAPSPRRIEPKRAREIVAKLPPQVERVGVFANETVERLCAIVREVGLTAVQLHGTESGESIAELHAALSNGKDARLIRALKPPTAEPNAHPSARSFLAANGIFSDDPSSELLAAVLVDSACGLQRGGTGETFDWEAARLFVAMLNARVKVIVAGGLTPGNVGEAIATLRPWGVDVCSGVEREHGKKDHEKMRAFVAAVRAADRL